MRTALALCALVFVALLEEVPHVISVVDQSTTAVIGHGHTVADKKVGQYTIEARLTRVFEDHLDIMIVIKDQDRTFALRFKTKVEALRPIVTATTIDLVKEKGKTVGIILYFDDGPPLEIQFNQPPSRDTALQPQTTRTQSAVFLFYESKGDIQLS